MSDVLGRVVTWIPAFAGMTAAFAGMTAAFAGMTARFRGDDRPLSRG